MADLILSLPNPNKTNKLKLKNFFAGICGNLLEYFDFALFGFLSPVLAANFFAKDNESSLLITLLIYAGGFIARPIGAIIFGYIGDIYGRKLSMLISIILMAISCASISLLPTYSQIGNYSTGILSLLRFLQGICMGGEYSIAMIFTIEHANNERQRMLASSLIAASTLFACLIAALTSALLLYINVNDWNWRIPFLLGSFIAWYGLYLRNKIVDTPVFTEYTRINAEGNNINTLNVSKKKGKKDKTFERLEINPSKKLIIKFIRDYKVLTEHKLNIAVSFLLFSIAGTCAGLSTTFLNSYLHKIYGLELYKSLIIMSLFLVFYILGTLLPLLCKTKIAHQKFLLSFLVILAITSLIALSVITSGKENNPKVDLFLLILTQSLFAIVSGGVWGSINLTITSIFASNLRCRAIALSDAMARAFIAGQIPVLAMYMLNTYNSLKFLGLCLFTACIITSLIIVRYFLSYLQVIDKNRY